MPQEKPPTIVIVQNPVSLQPPSTIAASIIGTGGLALDGTPISTQALDAGGTSVAGWLSQIRKSILDLQTQQKDQMQAVLIELRLLNLMLANPSAFNMQQELEQLRDDLQQDIQ